MTIYKMREMMMEAYGKLMAVIGLFGVLAVLPLHAEWTQNGGVGPFDYNDTGNWFNNTIDGVFSADPTDDLNVTFGANTNLTDGLELTFSGDQDMTFRSADGDYRTLTLGSRIGRDSAVGAGTITIGTLANPLSLNLNGNGGLRIGSSISNARTWSIGASISNGGLQVRAGSGCG